METFKTSLDNSCKLAIPKTKSIFTNDELYKKWINSFKSTEGGDETLKDKHTKHQKMLRWLIKKVKSEHYALKFN